MFDICSLERSLSQAMPVELPARDSPVVPAIGASGYVARRDRSPPCHLVDDHRCFIGFGMTDQTDPRLSSPAVFRNRGPILDILRKVLPAHGMILEVASGSGEHVTYLAERLPALEWQPSDPSPAARASIAAWTAADRPDQRAAAARPRCQRPAVAYVCCRRHPGDQHGAHQPVGGNARSAARSGATAAVRWTAVSSTDPSSRRA